MITLQPFTEADFPRLIGWIDCAAMLMQWAGPGQFVFPLTQQQLELYLQASVGEKPSRLIFAATDEDGSVCGHIELGAISYENETATICRVMVAPEARGKGFCLPMVRQILQIGFEKLRLRRIELRVYNHNVPAIRCYEKAGFVKEGLLRQAQKVGDQIRDTFVMGILREEWRSLAVND